MSVVATPTTVFPVTTGYEHISRDAVDEYETLKAGAGIGSHAWAEKGEPAPPSFTGAPSPPPEDSSSDLPDEDGADDDEDVADDDPDAMLLDGEGTGPVASKSAKNVSAAALADVNVGISAYGDDAIISPDYANQPPDAQPAQPVKPGALNPPFIRPFVRWNLIPRKDMRCDASPCPEGSFDPKGGTGWRRFAASALRRGIRGDVTITTDARVGAGGTKEFTAREYKEALEKLLRKYGRVVAADGTVTNPGVIDNLMAWNEPQYEGNGRPNKPYGVNNGNPLQKKPVLAGQLWTMAMAACFPDGPMATSARCGHNTADGSWEAGWVVAGEHIGAKGLPLRQSGKSLPYKRHYLEQVRRDARKVAGPNFQRRLPEVWSFHDLGDFKNFYLFGLQKTPTIDRYRRLYTSDDYKRINAAGHLVSPRIWLTETGGVNYRTNCLSLRPNPMSEPGPLRRSKKAYTEFCANNSKRIALLGMRRQAQTMGFLVRKLADPVNKVIKRTYYYQFVTAAECNQEKEGPFKCPLSETGLVGANDDNVYIGEATSGTAPAGRVDPAPGLSFGAHQGANDNRYSRGPPPREPGKPRVPGNTDRRFAFCLLRDRKPFLVRNPKRFVRGADGVRPENCSAGRP